MNDAGAQIAAGGRKRFESVKQRVDQRAAAAGVLIVAGAGMNHHPGRLVDHREIRVFINHVERNVLGGSLERRRMRLPGNVDALAATEF